MMKEIFLTQGKVTLVDDGDFEKASQYRWRAHRQRNGNFYVETTLKINGEYKTINLHNFLIKPPRGMMCDHLDGNGLNNQRDNLVIVTSRQNGQNRHDKKTSKYPGVSFHKSTKKWESCIRINGKNKCLGLFSSEQEAFSSYKTAVNDLGQELHPHWNNK
jgi:hypothetical protein